MADDGVLVVVDEERKIIVTKFLLITRRLRQRSKRRVQGAMSCNKLISRHLADSEDIMVDVMTLITGSVAEFDVQPTRLSCVAEVDVLCRSCDAVYDQVKYFTTIVFALNFFILLIIITRRMY